MKKIIFFLLVAGIGLIFCTSCKKDNAAISQTQNLILNPSFEINGQPTAENWFFGAGIEGDTSSTSLSQDTPPRGGNWSLPLSPGWVPQVGYAETYINALEGTNVYELHVWMKSNNGWRGSISIGIGVKSQKLYPDPLTQVKWASDTVTNWTEYVLIDTLTTQVNDTIVVRLSAGSCEVCAGAVLYDLIKLIKK